MLTDVLVEVKAGEVNPFGGCSLDAYAQNHLATERIIPASVSFRWALGIDGPAFLKPDAQDVDTRLHVLHGRLLCH